MMRLSHLQKVLIVAALFVLIGIGSVEWWKPMAMVCGIYFLTFFANLWRRMYESENVVTRALFGFHDSPAIAAILLLVVSIAIDKTYSGANLDTLYMTAAMGITVTVIARLKSGRLYRQ